MTKPTALNSISTPLNSVCLIEASAGTGKTYTMGSLYLRLLLNAGQNNFARPLSVEQILVVTFTEAATEELKERIRGRISEARIAFQRFLETGDSAVSEDDFLMDLLHHISEKNELKAAIHRLQLAEQNMDLAAIHTIHGFCRKMLMQYAFNSGIHFNLALLKDESELITRFANEVWRENFYQLSLPEVKFLLRIVDSPKAMAKEINLADLPDSRYRHLLPFSPAQFIRHYHDEISRFKQSWRNGADDLQNALEQARQQKRINTKKYSEKSIAKWMTEINQWACNPDDITLPARFSSHFCQTAIAENTPDGAEPFTHALLQQADKLLSVPYDRLFHYPCAEAIKQKLTVHKQNHAEKSFDDLLRLLQEALLNERGDELAQLICYQYPFAMIDEFQDTDARQYQIFRRIYIENPTENSGFIMIGDPKQAIYKFRGADIFTYLNAANEAKARFNLGKNWRSVPDLVNGVNALFDFSGKSPFLYENIVFQPVEHCASRAKFRLNDQIQPSFNFYLTGEADTALLAKACAASIQQWLKSAQRNQAFLGDNPLKAKNIAILVRNWKEAEQIKSALQELSIASVYLSDKNNVFDAKEAAELALILTACLNPANERNILNAIATALFALSAAEIQRIKQDENHWEMWVERFEKYKRRWMQQGVLPMLHQLYLQESIPAGLLSQSGGERRLTDLLHLTELLQQAAALHENEASLLRWFERQIRGENRTDEQEIRLESEQELVKIVTVHKSKGLEYDIVWLPFVGQGIRKNNDSIRTYYSEKAHKVLWDIDNSHENEVLREQKAEEMRLLYVALTRAKFQLNIALPAQVQHRRNELPWNPLAYALSQGETAADCEFRPLIESFAARAGIAMNIIDTVNTVNIEADEWRPQSAVSADLNAAVFRGEIEKNWQISSFTALNQMHEHNGQKQRRGIAEQYVNTEAQSAVENNAVFYDEAQDYDVIHYSSDEMHSAPENETPAKYPAGKTPFDFPRSSRIGTYLHRYFEDCKFNQPVDVQQIIKLCRAAKLDESWFEPAEMWMRDILTTPLTEDINLAEIDRTSCLKELQFYFKLKDGFPLKEFNRLLRIYHPLYRKPWLFDELQGMVRGFIDLVFRCRGKYYLLDYKSNFLGSCYEDYSAVALNQTMREAGYDLQYLLYTLALHRYLKQRDPKYRYEQDFGGVIYGFLRGMNGKNNTSGVYFDKPQAELIEQLDSLF